MQIDWFTLLAEIANFLILVYLLRRFLYKPIVGIADAREAQIGERYAEAENRAADAQAEAAAYQKEREKLEAQRQDLLDDARREADEERRRLMAHMRQEVSRERREWQEQIAQQRESFLQRLQQQTVQEVYATSARVLADLADADLQASAVNAFLARLREMPEEDVKALREAFAGGDLEVITAFPLPEATQRDMTVALQEMLDVPDPAPTFSQDEQLICGIAVRIDGHKVNWNVQRYLDRLHEKVDSAIREAATGEVKVEAAHA
jgi:F-type H+-transporting ATPase subunit b